MSPQRVQSMPKKTEPAKPSAPVVNPTLAVGKLVGVAAGTLAGVAALTTGLVMSIPAPDALLRAVVAGIIVRVIAGALGTSLARSMFEAKAAQPVAQGSETG